ncbi:MAG: hypothetical protein R3F11_31615 [Verrucomicrobiales bacterium]
MKYLPNLALTAFGVAGIAYGIHASYQKYQGTDLSRVPSRLAAGAGASSDAPAPAQVQAAAITPGTNRDRAEPTTKKRRPPNSSAQRRPSRPPAN